MPIISLRTQVNRGEIKSKYPLLKIHPKYNLIVLFTSPRNGVLIDKGETLQEVGKYVTYWSEDEFEIYENAIILSNQW